MLLLLILITILSLCVSPAHWIMIMSFALIEQAGKHEGKKNFDSPNRNLPDREERVAFVLIVWSTLTQPGSSRREVRERISSTIWSDSLNLPSPCMGMGTGGKKEVKQGEMTWADCVFAAEGEWSVIRDSDWQEQQACRKENEWTEQQKRSKRGSKSHYPAHSLLVCSVSLPLIVFHSFLVLIQFPFSHPH